MSIERAITTVADWPLHGFRTRTQPGLVCVYEGDANTPCVTLTTGGREVASVMVERGNTAAVEALVAVLIRSLAAQWE